MHLSSDQNRLQVHRAGDKTNLSPFLHRPSNPPVIVKFLEATTKKQHNILKTIFIDYIDIKEIFVPKNLNYEMNYSS